MKEVAENQTRIRATSSRGVQIALAVYVAVVPIAYWIGLVAPGRKNWPLWMYAAVTHGVLCALIGFVTKAVVGLLELLRFDVHMEGEVVLFLRTLAVWPSVVVIWMLVRKCLQ
jgi:hypothetical protein